MVSLLLTLNNFTPCPSVFIVNFEHVIAGWDISDRQYFLRITRKGLPKMHSFCGPKNNLSTKIRGFLLL